MTIDLAASREYASDPEFEHLCQDVFPEGSKQRIMAYLTTYFDASENIQRNRPHIYTVAGWVGEEEAEAERQRLEDEERQREAVTV
ncbi:MAG TPA: hypothetical protein VHE60_03660 [Pyrinomonadaceae bacterium]|nr:hypothetical protein [Pyrinomonadaceae bacterium]